MYPKGCLYEDLWAFLGSLGGGLKMAHSGELNVGRYAYGEGCPKWIIPLITFQLS